MLFILYTGKMPENENVVIVTFAKDTAMLGISADERKAILQNHLKETEKWLTNLE